MLWRNIYGCISASLCSTVATSDAETIARRCSFNFRKIHKKTPVPESTYPWNSQKFLTFTVRNLFFDTSNSYLEVVIQNDFKKSAINFFYLLCWDQRNLTKKAYYCIDNTHTYTHTHAPTHKMTKQKSQYYPHLFPTNVSPDLANQCRQQQVSLLDC